MQKASLKTVAEKMKDIDFCMMITRDGRGGYHSRSMSNNGKVEHDGDSWFFTMEDSNKVRQIEKDAQVCLVYQNDKMRFIQCLGQGSVIRQKTILAEKWVNELSQWFPKGVETPGLCLVKVRATRVQFWDKEKEGEYEVA